MRKKNTQKKKDYETKDRLENRPFYKLFTRIFWKKICCSLTCLLSNDDGKIRFYDSDNGNEMKKKENFPPSNRIHLHTHNLHIHFFSVQESQKKNQYLWIGKENNTHSFIHSFTDWLTLAKIRQIKVFTIIINLSSTTSNVERNETKKQTTTTGWYSHFKSIDTNTWFLVSSSSHFGYIDRKCKN